MSSTLRKFVETLRQHFACDLRSVGIYGSSDKIVTIDLVSNRLIEIMVVDTSERRAWTVAWDEEEFVRHVRDSISSCNTPSYFYT